MPNIIKPPLPGWEATNDAADDCGVHQRTLIKGLNEIGAAVLYWGGKRHNKTADRESVIRNRIQRRNPPRRARRLSHHQEITA
jgi:hypothetical protein